ncbi:MAG: hypothetical protein ACYDGM_08830, partial [Vulcanimicrobiaceae bacterium]
AFVSAREVRALLRRSLAPRWVRLNATKLGPSYPGANTGHIERILLKDPVRLNDLQVESAGFQAGDTLRPCTLVAYLHNNGRKSVANFIRATANDISGNVLICKTDANQSPWPPSGTNNAHDIAAAAVTSFGNGDAIWVHVTIAIDAKAEVDQASIQAIFRDSENTEIVCRRETE